MKPAAVSVQFALCVLYSLGSYVDLAPVNQGKPHIQALLADYNGAFEAFDQDGDGKITKEELATGMRSIEKDITDSEVEVMLTFADKNGDGMIDYNDFLKSSADMVDESLKKVFSFFDKDSDGLISLTELRDAIKSVQEDLSEEEIQAKAQRAACNNNGSVNYEGFFKAITKKK